MRLLLVAMPDSPHVAGWLRLLEGTGWELFVISPYRARPLPGVPQRRVTPLTGARNGLVSAFPTAVGHYAEALFAFTPWRRRWRGRLVESSVRHLRPDIIHSMEFQHCGYLCLAARSRMRDFPVWIATNWGSDIAHFAADDHHRAMIAKLLESIDVYSAECHRDVELARRLGCTAPAFPVVPNNGGFDVEECLGLRSGAPSTRRRLMVKGYEHFSGRALTALEALGRIERELQGYEVLVYSASPVVVDAVRSIQRQGRIDVRCVPKLSQRAMLELHGGARVSISVGTSDGISISMLEAMVMGSYPIQTVGACAHEWIDHRLGGSLVDVDSETIADEILLALRDDDLVDGAAEVNKDLAVRELDRDQIRAKVIAAYESAAATGGRDVG